MCQAVFMKSTVFFPVGKKWCSLFLGVDGVTHFMAHYYKDSPSDPLIAWQHLYSWVEAALSCR